MGLLKIELIDHLQVEEGKLSWGILLSFKITSLSSGYKVLLYTLGFR